MGFLGPFLAATFLDALPAFAPPSWMALVFLQVRYGMDVPLVVAGGLAGSVLGRLILTLYIHRVAHHILSRREQKNIDYLGRRLGKNKRADFLIVFLYSLTPLPTAPLFLAAGMADIGRGIMFPPFALGRLVALSLIVAAGRASAGSLTDLVHGHPSPQAVLVSAAGLALVGAMLFVDWRALFHDGKLRLETGILAFGRAR